MDRITSLKKLNAYLKNPELIKEPSYAELANLVVMVLGSVSQIEKAIKEGRLNGITPQPDKDYMSKSTALKMLTSAVKDITEKYDTEMRKKGSVLETQVRDAIARIRDGENGIVTDEDIQRAGEIATELVKEQIDFSTFVTQEPNAIRDALELLPEGEKLSVKAVDNITIEDIQGLQEALDELRNFVGQASTVLGGGATRNFVKDYVAQNAGGTTPYTPVETTGTTFTGNGGTPKYIIMNGMTYFEDNGYTFASNTVTTDYALEADGFIRIFY